MMFRPICWRGASGGIGTSTIMHATALELATADLPVYIAGDYDTIPIMGAPSGAHDPLRLLTNDTNPVYLVDDSRYGFEEMAERQCGVLFMSGSLSRYDLGSFDHPEAPFTIGVVANSYLSTRRAAGFQAGDIDAWVLSNISSNALQLRDVERIVYAPVVATVDINPRVARLVDAGLLIDDRSRIRAGLHLALRPLITTIKEAIRPGSSMP